MYVVKLGSNRNDWTFFSTFEAAERYAVSYDPTGRVMRPELNLSYC